MVPDIFPPMNEAARHVKVAVLIATSGRFDLLEQRALRSVRLQERQPDAVILVVDTDLGGQAEQEARTIAQRVWAGAASLPTIVILGNRRTRKSASGAWNSGIDELCRRYGSEADKWYVAILDDDDAWRPEHLDKCAGSVMATAADMAIPGLIRHDSPEDAGRRQEIPSALLPDQIFVKNPHIQGSNLFLRLTRLLEVGGFDENLPSCTDRDLCLRLERLLDFKVAALDDYTVHHYADPRPDRLTVDRSAKGEGLRRFFAKHAGDHDADAHQEFMSLAKARFGFDQDYLRQTADAPQLAASTDGVAKLDDAQGLYLVVGFVTDSCLPDHALRLVQDIAELPSQDGVLGVSAVMVENGPIDDAGRRRWHAALEDLGRAGVKIVRIRPEEIAAEWAPYQAVSVPDARAARLPIAVTRTILNRYVYQESKEHPGAAAWILDDDKSFTFEVRSSNGARVTAVRSPNIAQLLALRARGVDVVIGQDSAAAPLPFESTLRLQLLDLDQSLRRLARRPGQAVPWQNVDRRAAGYYDLSRETRYLETPLPGDFISAVEPVESIRRAAFACQRMRAGQAITRPLMIDEESMDLAAAHDSIARGGSTLFFKPEQLMLCPQYSAKVGGGWVRRSDMLHSLVLSRLYGVKIVMHAAVAVRHGRETSTPIEKLTDTMRHDVLGYGLYRGAEAALALVPAAPARGICGIFFDPAVLGVATATARKTVRERLAAMELSAWRIHGLVGACLKSLGVLRQAPGMELVAVADLEAELGKIKALMDPAVIRGLAQELLAGTTEKVFSLAYREIDLEAVTMQKSFKAWRTEALKLQRVERARRILGLTEGVELLGVGWEGVVFRQGDSTVKLIDIAKPARIAAALPALLRLERLAQANTSLCRIKLSRSDEGLPVIEREFVEQSPAGSPSLGQLLRLLEDCKEVGVVFRNLSRENITLLAGRAMIIDYGLDFAEFSEAEYVVMARKAWLCARFWAREDLNRLLSLAWQDPGAPELEGFEEFWRWYAGGRKTATALCAEMTEAMLAEGEFGKVLDYGCGKQAHTVRRFHDLGKAVVGYDPGAGIASRWEKQKLGASGLRLTDSREVALSQGPYDAVVCSLVLCELASAASLREVVADLGAAVGPGGKVVVVLCDPIGTFGPPTAIHLARNLPAQAAYPSEFEYGEIAESGRPRKEFHRSLRTIRRTLLATGLRIVSERCNQAYDLETGLPATDFLGWVCEKIPTHDQSASVSLVVKASALEADTLEAQVEHLVEQLERPRVFAQRLLAIDSRLTGFVREYGLPDLRKTLTAAERLKERGFIDEVIVAPADGSAEAADINHRWFGERVPWTHTAAGAPLASPLGAFERCHGDYVLQVDADLLVRRANPDHDFIGEAMRAMKANPRCFTVSLNIIYDQDQPFRGEDEEGRPYRVECRGCLFDRRALLALRPFANQVDADGRLRLAWHRAMDLVCLEGRAVSLRGGARQTGFVHPSNTFKRSSAEWNLVMTGMEHGGLCEGQASKVDLVGSALQWLPPPRPESFIFVVTGRNVSYGKMVRCYQSMLRQKGVSWGAVVIDDGSDELSREACRRVFGQAPNITLLQPRRRRGQLANTITAIRDLCADPEAVIVTLDMDDSLIGSDVLLELAKEYDHGADLTVGSMVRTDKPADYPARFGDLRAARGGNVWQHLRSFRKRLFDGIPDWRLRLDGQYVEICVDWAFMVPMVERAKTPRYLSRKLYYYESSGLGKGGQLAARETAIARIMRRHVPGGHSRSSSGLITKEDIMARDWKGANGLLILRHADRPSLKGLGKGADEVSITEKGRADSYALGLALGQATQVVASGVLRARQTAEEIMRAIGHESSSVRTFRSLCRLSANHADRAAYDAHKQRLGWHALVDAWIDGALDDPGAVLPSHESAMGALRELLAADGLRQQGLNIAITHDFYVHALLEVMYGQRQWRGRGIPTLAGVYLDYDDARTLIASHGA